MIVEEHVRAARARNGTLAVREGEAQAAGVPAAGAPVIGAPATGAPAVGAPAAEAQLAERLRCNTAAVRVSFTWFGTRKALTPTQKGEAADAFGAEGAFLSAGKKLLDTRDPKYRAVTQVKGRATAYWRSFSLPYPEPGLRLIRRDRISAFTEAMREYQVELASAVLELDGHLDSLKSAARERLGRLFDPADYPASLSGQFDLSWEFPSVEPPDYLRRLHPELYREECRRARSRFEEAIALAEQAFTQELAKHVQHLAERLSGLEDGMPKVFRDSAVENLREFYARFRELSVGSNGELDEVVRRAESLLGNIPAQELRDRPAARERIAAGLAEVQIALEPLLAERPRRRILRSPR
jgi:hypothetical protein